MIELACRLAAASLLAIAGGLPLVTPACRPGLADLAAAWTLALGNAAVLALAAGLAGWTLAPWVLALLLIAPGLAIALVRKARASLSPAVSVAAGREVGRGAQDRFGRGVRRQGNPSSGEGSRGRVGWLPGVALAVAAVLSAAKMAAVPLWSWDHFAIWGVKTRTMLPGGHLRLEFLGSLYQSRVDHPLGLPMAWLVLTFGQAPDPTAFKALHAVFACVLAVLLQAAVARITSSREVGCAAAAVLVISPLFWDSEAIGLAELPLALWTVAGLYLLIRGPVGAIRLPWVPGLALGFLPWIKQEGLPLALLALAFCALATVRPGAEGTARFTARGWLALGAPAALLLTGAWAVQRWALPPGASFFAGAWCRRGIARLPEVGAILRHCVDDLLQPDWLGFWVLLAAATCAAALRRRRRALALTAVVWCQVAVYMLTALFSYIAPHDHLNAAFFRICAPLMPPGLLAIAMALTPPAPAEAGPPPEGLL